MTVAKLIVGAGVALTLAACQTTVVRREPPPPRGPVVGETRLAQLRAGDFRVTLRDARPGFRRFVVGRADGRPARGGARAEQVAINAVRRAYPRGACARGRAPRVERAQFRPGPGRWAVDLSCG